jgi:hypothetical protein
MHRKCRLQLRAVVRTTRFQTRNTRAAAWHEVGHSWSAEGLRTPNANSVSPAHIGRAACARAGEVDYYQHQLSIGQWSHPGAIIYGPCHSDLPWHIAIVELMQSSLYFDRLHRMLEHDVAVLLSYALPL